MGLSVLPYMSAILAKRAEQSQLYKQLLQGLRVTYPKVTDVESYNHSYFPMIFPEESQLLKSMEILEHHGVGCRRYFYPALHTLDYTTGHCPVTAELSPRVLCLPLYHTLSKEEQRMIVRMLLRVQNN